jgi:glycerol-3-phosphate acyltransferase PlsY
MSPSVLLPLTILGAYLIGGIPFGYLVGRWRGVNIFEHGSGNIGATNVGRVLGRKYGILVFVLDFAKGALPTALAVYVGQEIAPADLGDLPRELFGVGAGLAAFLGHLFPVYLRFRGGKGVATGAGVVVVLFPGPAAGALVAWLAMVLASRIVSLASIVAALTLCLLHLLTTPAPFSPGRIVATIFGLLAALLIVVKHRTNIQRLVQGTENRLEESTAMNQLCKTVHVMSLGLWFGSAAFFILVVTTSIFHTFETVATEHPRQTWFPLSGNFPLPDGPKEQGSRAAGYVVGPLFGRFFLLQLICGLLAAATCLNWPKTHPHERVHRLRAWLVVAALLTVVIGWLIEQKVVELRGPRNQATDVVLMAGVHDDVKDAQRAEMESARSAFAVWHLASLGLSFVTLALVTWAMALAARLPAAAGLSPAPKAPSASASAQEDDTVIQAVAQDTGTAQPK